MNDRKYKSLKSKKYKKNFSGVKSEMIYKKDNE